MATYTTNYNLTKPDTTDVIDISVLNDNFDAIDAAMAAAQSVVVGDISLSATWTDEGSNVYSQIVTITNVTTASKIDLQPDSTVLAQLLTDGVTALWAVNNSGTITVYAMGAAPSAAMTVQYSKQEVTV